MKSFTRHLSLLAIVLLWLGCEHKDLCYHHPHAPEVRVEFRWDSTQVVPRAMRVFFYPINEAGGPPYVFDFQDSKGGVVKVPYGKYNVICYNIDTDNVVENSLQQIKSLELTSSTLNPIIERPAGIVTYDQPPIIVSDKQNNVSLESRGETPQVVVLTPKTIIYTYTFEIQGIQNLKYAEEIKASLSNISGSFFPGSQTLSSQGGEVLFEGYVQDGIVRGSFRTWGVLPQGDSHFTLFIRTKDKKIYKSFDVTQQVSPSENDFKREIHIVIRTQWDIPSPIGNGEGFKPEVESWEPAVEREIEI